MYSNATALTFGNRFAYQQVQPIKNETRQNAMIWHRLTQRSLYASAVLALFIR